MIAHPEAYLHFIRLQLEGLIAMEEVGGRPDWPARVRELLTQTQETEDDED